MERKRYQSFEGKKGTEVVMEGRSTVHPWYPLVDVIRARAWVPYSGNPVSALVVLSDGTWIPGVRVESASFSLTLPAVVNAITTAVACGRTDAIAVLLSRAATAGERAYLAETACGAFQAWTDSVFVRDDKVPLPRPTSVLSPVLPGTIAQVQAGITQARQCTTHAYIPASQFPVGCVLQTRDGLLIPGVNVEHADWSHILCAERNALGTALSYGLTDLHTLYLSCPLDPLGYPCGACRQLLAEHAPDMPIWMDRHDEPPDRALAADLLPDFFSGHAIARPSDS